MQCKPSLTSERATLSSDGPCLVRNSPEEHSTFKISRYGINGRTHSSRTIVDCIQANPVIITSLNNFCVLVSVREGGGWFLGPRLCGSRESYVSWCTHAAW